MKDVGIGVPKDKKLLWCHVVGLLGCGGVGMNSFYLLFNLVRDESPFLMMEKRSADSMRAMASICCIKVVKSLSRRYFRSLAISSWHETSINDPYAISMKWTFSLVETLPKPSAILEGMEITARRSWSQRANFSSWGNKESSWYTAVTNSLEYW